MKLEPIDRATIILSLLFAIGCESAPPPPGSASLTGAQRSAIADTVTALLRGATNLAPLASETDVNGAARMLALYPDSGQVVSASGGFLLLGRDSLESAVTGFWENVGQNMVRPEWRWGEFHVDVLAPDAAVVTASYRIPHLTPTGHAHVIGGVWTAVFANRDGRWVIVQEHLSDAPPGMSLTP